MCCLILIVWRGGVLLTSNDTKSTVYKKACLQVELQAVAEGPFVERLLDVAAAERVRLTREAAHAIHAESRGDLRHGIQCLEMLALVRQSSKIHADSASALSRASCLDDEDHKTAFTDVRDLCLGRPEKARRSYGLASQGDMLSMVLHENYVSFAPEATVGIAACSLAADDMSLADLEQTRLRSGRYEDSDYAPENWAAHAIANPAAHIAAARTSSTSTGRHRDLPQPAIVRFPKLLKVVTASSALRKQISDALAKTMRTWTSDGRRTWYRVPTFENVVTDPACWHPYVPSRKKYNLKDS